LNRCASGTGRRVAPARRTLAQFRCDCTREQDAAALENPAPLRRPAGLAGLLVRLPGATRANCARTAAPVRRLGSRELCVRYDMTEYRDGSVVCRSKASAARFVMFRRPTPSRDRSVSFVLCEGVSRFMDEAETRRKSSTPTATGGWNVLDLPWSSKNWISTLLSRHPVSSDPPDHTKAINLPTTRSCFTASGSRD